MSCPICGKPAAADRHPFCSRRCADVDLARWLGGRYAIPGAPVAEDELPARVPPDGPASD